MVRFKNGDILVDKHKNLYIFLCYIGAFPVDSLRRINVQGEGFPWTMPMWEHEVKLAEFAQTELYKALDGEIDGF